MSIKRALRRVDKLCVERIHRTLNTVRPIAFRSQQIISSWAREWPTIRSNLALDVCDQRPIHAYEIPSCWSSSKFHQACPHLREFNFKSHDFSQCVNREEDTLSTNSPLESERSKSINTGKAHAIRSPNRIRAVIKCSASLSEKVVNLIWREKTRQDKHSLAN